MHKIKTEDVYKDFSNDKEMLDFSNYSTNSKYYDNSNKLVVGKIEDETAGVPIEQFVGLKLKNIFVHYIKPYLHRILPYSGRVRVNTEQNSSVYIFDNFPVYHCMRTL